MRHFFSRLGLRLAPALLAAALLLTTAQTLWAGILEGQVVGADGQPLANLRIDIFGPQKRVTVTDQEGRFAVDAPGGVYRIRISKHPQQVEYRATIPDQGKAQRQFRVEW